MLSKRFTLVFALFAGFLCLVGTAYAFTGDCPPSYMLNGENTGDRFGQAVAGIGDINGDGTADILIGAPRNATAGDYAGRVYVYSGADGTLLQVKTAAAAEDNYGHSVAGAGDVNGDGYADYIVGAPYHDAAASDAGRAYVYSGQDGVLLYTFDGEGDNDWFGESVSGAGDVNGDGFDDIIIGSPQYGSPARGCAYVFSGQDGSLLHSFVSTTLYAYLGNAVAGAGDVDGDGFADLVVGAPAVGSFMGEAYVFSGQTGSLLYTLASGHPDAKFGQAVAGIGDVDADGFPDVIVGAWTDETDGDDAGRVFVYSGNTGALIHEVGQSGDQSSIWFGASVAGAGDIDDDGYTDFLVGRSRGVSVFSGVNATLIKTIEIQPSSTFFGTSVSSNGSLASAGHADIIVGRFDENEGQAYIYSCYCDCECGIWGDVTNDAAVNPVDVVYMVNFVYKNQDARIQPPGCPDTVGDMDCSQLVNPVDVVYLVNFVYKNQSAFCDPCTQ